MSDSAGQVRGSNPVLIDVTRDPKRNQPSGPSGADAGFVESFHRGAIAIVDASGRSIAGIGDVDRAICPRSALKPLQALAFLESGALDEFDLGPQEVALSAASHNGEPIHVQAVANWLKKIDCTIDQLECGPPSPGNEPGAHNGADQGREVSALHNCCSGKHVGFMSLARVMGVDVTGYTDESHPVQKRVAAIVSEMVGFDVTTARVGADGCAAPNYAIPLKAMAHGLARMARTESLVPLRASAVTTLLSAVGAHPVLLAGNGQPSTILIENLTSGGLVKSGVEGVYGAILPGLDVGIAVKVDDGADRAATMIMANVLVRLGALDRGSKQVEDLVAPKITNTTGATVGRIATSEAWESFSFAV